MLCYELFTAVLTGVAEEKGRANGAEWRVKPREISY